MMVHLPFAAAVTVAITLLLAEQVLGFWRSESNRPLSFATSFETLTLLHSELQCHSSGQDCKLCL
jgi:hypothetical protein